MLIVLGGLPGTGKTTIARGLAGRVRGVPLRVDAIEQALRGSVPLGSDLGGAGYAAAGALAEDLLKLGQVVIADCVNPTGATRAAWRAVAARAGVPIVEIEVVRADAPAPAIAYEPWERAPVTIDTAGRTIDQSLAEAVGALQIY